MPTSPDDIAALFGLPPEPASSQPAEPSTVDAEAAEAALAIAEAELAAELGPTIGAGGVATDAPDSRTDPRTAVSWPARMRLSDGRVIELKVRNISESGVGLLSDEDIPADIVVDLEMDVPPPGEGVGITTVQSAIRTTYKVAHGSEILCGGTWEAPPAGLEPVSAWIERLRGRSGAMSSLGPRPATTGFR